MSHPYRPDCSVPTRGSAAVEYVLAAALLLLALLWLVPQLQSRLSALFQQALNFLFDYF